MLTWIPAVATTALLSAALWLSRNWIAARLTNSIRHEYDEKLERLRAELRARETQIAALRDGALTGVMTRQGNLYQRKLDAVHRLWVCLVEYAPYNNSLLLTSAVDADLASTMAHDPHWRKFFESFAGAVPQPADVARGAENERPFVSDMAWALYRAYTVLMQVAYVKVMLLAKGLDVQGLYTKDTVADSLKKALPDLAAYIDEHGQTVHYRLAETLIERILSELRRIMDGQQEDAESIQRAASILHASEVARGDLAKKQAEL